MLPANSYTDILAELRGAFERRGATLGLRRMVGLLFAPPYTAIGEKEFVPRLDYYHHRSGPNVDLFCVGYGGYLPSSFKGVKHLWEQRTPDGSVIPWAFSTETFNAVRAEMEERLKWSYSGEADLLLLDGTFDTANGVAQLDLSQGIVLDLASMLNDKVIASVPRLFEEIFRYAEAHPAGTSAVGFSDRKGVRIVGSSLLDALIEALPKSASAIWKQGIHFRTLGFERHP